MNKKTYQNIDKPENLTYWFNNLGICDMKNVEKIEVIRADDYGNFLLIVELI